MLEIIQGVKDLNNLSTVIVGIGMVVFTAAVTRKASVLKYAKLAVGMAGISAAVGVTTIMLIVDENKDNRQVVQTALVEQEQTDEKYSSEDDDKKKGTTEESSFAEVTARTVNGVLSGETETQQELPVRLATATVQESLLEYSSENIELVDNKLRCKEDSQILQWQKSDNKWECKDTLEIVLGETSQSVQTSSSGAMECSNDEEFLFWDDDNKEWDCGSIGDGIDIDIEDLANVSDENPVNGEVLTWNDASSEWEAAVSSGGSGADTQDLSITGHTISLVDGGSVTVPDDNTTYTNGTGLGLAGGVFSLNSGIDNLSDVDTTTITPTNNQVLSWDGTDWIPTNASVGADTQDLSIVGHTISLVDGGSVVVPDNDTTYTAGNGLAIFNEQFFIQAPTCTGTDKLTWSGNMFFCVPDVDTTYTAGTGLGLSSGVFSLNSGIDNLSDVDTTTTAPTSNQVLSWDGSNWTPTTSYAPVAGTTTNNTLRWNGTDWVESAALQNDGTNLTATGNAIINGTVTIGAYTLPNIDGTINQILKTNGSGGVAWGGLIAEDIGINKIGTPTYDNLQDTLNILHSAGKISGGDFTDNGDGTIGVAAGMGIIKTGANADSPAVSFDWAGDASVAIVDGELNYIYIDYNAGTPIIGSQVGNIGMNHRDKIGLGKVYREGNKLHFISTGMVIAEIPRSVLKRFVGVDGHIVRGDGILVSETGVRNIAVSAGTLFGGLEELTLSAKDTSGTDDFNYFYRDGLGGWTEVGAQTQISNTQYDDGSGTLATLSAGRHSIHWVYVLADGTVEVLYGQGNYLKLSDAESVLAPATVPDVIAKMGFLAARIIVVQNATTFTSVSSAFGQKFTPTPISEHNDLAGMQGGQAGEYYHMTAAGSVVLGNTSGVNTGDQDVVDDTTPQLGGNLDVNGRTILSVSNGDISLNPDGTGKVTTDKSLGLLNTTHTDQVGIIYKGVDTFLHNFNYGNNTTVTTEGYNTFLGEGAGNLTMGATATSASEASSNTVMGAFAFASNTIGEANTAQGVSALYSNTTGSHNVAQGVNTLAYNTTGEANIGIGSESLINNVAGDHNIAIGYQAGMGTLGTSIAQNTIIGTQAGYALTTGGNNNTLIGFQAGANLTSGARNVIIGHNISAPTATGVQTMSIANLIYGNTLDGTGTTVSTGNIGIGVINPTNFKLEIAGNVGPSANDTYDLGSATNRWQDLYLGPQSLHIGTNGDEGVLSYNTTNDTFDFDKGLKIGTTTNNIAGSLRWTGTAFEGNDGASWSSFGGGSGDMLKTTYDTNDDGIADRADLVTGEQAGIINETENLLHGMSNKQQALNVVVDTGVVYMEIEAVGGGDIEYNMDGVERMLDCTTGSGAGGKARVVIPQGTATTIHRSMVYVFYDEQAGELSLATTRTQPVGAYAPVANIGIQDAATVLAEGPAIFQRTTEALEHNGKGAISWMREKLRIMGAEYAGGLDQSVDIVANGSGQDNINFTTTSGSVFQLHRQSFPAYSIATDGLWVSNADGTGSLQPMQKVTDMNILRETADGTALVDGDIVNLVIWGNVNYSASNARLNVNLPTDVYRNADNAKSDINNYAVTSFPGESKTTGFLIARVVLKYNTASGGTWTNVLGDSSTVWISESRNTSSTNYPSNYPNSTVEGYTITKSGASRVRLRFDAFNTEANYDYVKLSNGTGGTLFTYHGNLGPFTSGEVSGSRIDVDFTSDGSVTRPGFHINAIEYETTVLTGTKVIDLRGMKAGMGGSSGGMSASEEFEDSTVRIFDNVDTSKKLAFEVSAITTGTTRTISVPNGDGAVGLFTGLAGGQTLIGGTAVADGLTLQTTSGVGTTGADMHFLTGNNGSTEALTILNNGNIGIGETSPTEHLTMAGGNFLHTAEGDPTTEGNWDPNVTDTMSVTKASVIQGKYAYVIGSASDNMAIIDISNPASPTYVGDWDPAVDDTMNNPQDIKVAGKYAYVIGSASDNMAIIDISNPTTPTLVGDWDPEVDDTMNNPTSLYVSGNYAYITGGLSDNLAIVDISNPATPTYVGDWDPEVDDTMNNPTAVYVDGKYAYITGGDSDNLAIVDISNPATPTYVGDWDPDNASIIEAAFSVYVSGKYAYVAGSDSSSLAIINISNPTTPTLVGNWIPGDANIMSYARSVQVSGKYAYITGFTSDNMAVVDISNPASPVTVGNWDPGDINIMDAATSVYVSGKYAYVTGGDSHNLAIVDISGIDAPSATIGNLAVGSLDVWENTNLANDLYVGNGLVVGHDTLLAGKLSVDNAVRLSHFGAGTLSTDADGNVTVSSDERLKNIEGIFNRGIQDLLNINPIEYKWKDETGYDTDSSYYGFSAQNIKLNIPEAVGLDKNGYLTLSDRPILATAINALKELHQTQEDEKVKLTSTTLKTDVNITNLTGLQTSVDNNLTLINQELVDLKTDVNINTTNITTNAENIETNTSSLEALSDNINELSNSVTTLVDTVTNHEERIVAIENILAEGGVEGLNSPENTNILTISDTLQSFSDNLEMTEIVTEGEDDIIKFKIDGELKVKKVETDELVISSTETIGVATIEADTLNIEVETGTLEESSRIFVTPTSSIGTATYHVEKNIEDNKFIITISEILEEEAVFNWFIVQSSVETE